MKKQLSMEKTFSQIYIHYVFAVSQRRKLIQPSWKNDLYKYICGCISNHQCKVMQIGGTEDHIHILVSMSPAISPSKLRFHVKRSSSLWINQQGLSNFHFAWQEGFGAFTYSLSQIKTVANYIEHQEEHHYPQERCPRHIVRYAEARTRHRRQRRE